MEELRVNAEPDIAIMLVGNKVDLCDRQESVRQVPTKTGMDFANQNGLQFSETSAVTTLNVKDAFENLLQHIFNEKSKD
jgi:GTPase SAR1 family protein